jgi:hypothetical protein
MTKLPDSDVLARAPCDPEAAAQVLMIAARYLRAGEPLPDDLAKFLADAFESAGLKPDEHSRAKTLARDLHLIAGGNRRPKASYVEVGKAVEQLVSAGDSVDKAISKYTEHFNKEKSKKTEQISETTVGRHWRKYKNSRQKNAIF